MTDAELQGLLADLRPRPDAAWAARLDSRVERGFPPIPGRPRRGWRWPSLGMPAVAAGIACLVAAVIGVGLATRDNTGTMSSSSGGSAPAVKGPAADNAGSAASRAAPAATPPPAAAPGARRKVERSAELTLAAPRDRISSVADGIVHATEAAGGFVATSNVSTGGLAGASFTLRVPAGRLGRTITAISALAHVRSLNQSSLDITGVVDNAKARLRDRVAERASLRKQLAAETDPTQAARLRRQLRAAERAVTAASRTLARQDARASYSTLLVTVAAERKHAAAGGGAWTPRDALHDAARVLEVTAGVALIVLAAALPVGLLGAAAWAAVRVGTRRRRERALDMA
jgi:hypothetical protein